MRPTTPVFAALALLAVLLTAELAHARFAGASARERLAQEAALVAALGLSDPALFTEARYTRHPSLADGMAAFQDNPMGFDHFPSGSVMPAPRPPISGALGFSAEEVTQ